MSDRAKAQQRDRPQSVLLVGVAVVVALVMVGFAVFVLVNEQVEGNDQLAGEQQAAAEEEPVAGDEQVEADEPIAGLVEIDDLTSQHVEGTVEYEQTPPAGGAHNDRWLNCGIYSEPVPNENAAHSLEHGVVWITYQPDLAEPEVEQIRDFVTGQDATVRDKLLLSPYEGLPAPVVVSAWGRQAQLTGADDPRLDQFTDAFVSGIQSPEPFATCAGGIGTPE